MSLYNKYRPKTFTDIKGQDLSVTILKNAIKNNLINSSYIFYGQKGTGKTSMARIFARAINCENYINNPCNQCNSCKSILNNTAIDYVEIDAASNNGVENIRELNENTNYLPAHNKYKVYVIDEAHMLTRSAFNALLKTIEETPKNIVFILATTEFHKLPETIVSRCQAISFDQLNQNTIKEQLIEIINKEGMKLDKESIDLVIAESSGSMRDAINNIEKILVYSKKPTIAEVTKLFHFLPKSLILNFLNNVSLNNMMNVTNFFIDLKSKSINYKLFATQIIYYLYDYIFYQKTSSEKVLTKLNIKDIALLNLKNLNLNLIVEKLSELINERQDNEILQIRLELVFVNIMNTPLVEFDYMSNSTSKKEKSQEIQKTDVNKIKEIDTSEFSKIINESEKKTSAKMIKDKIETAIRSIPKTKTHTIRASNKTKELDKPNEFPKTKTHTIESSKTGEQFNTKANTTKINKTVQLKTTNEFSKTKTNTIEYDDTKIIKPKDIKINTDEVTKVIEKVDFDNKQQQPEMIKRDIRFDVEDLINILLQKDRINSDNIYNMWNKISEKFGSKKYGEFISLLLGGEFMFASKNAIVIYYKYSIECKKVLKYRYEKKFMNFIKELFHSEYLIFPINTDMKNNFVNRYNELKALPKEQLPEPKRIIIGKLDNTIIDATEIIKSEEKKLRDMFEDEK